MISVTILAKNSERTIEKVIEALEGFDEVLVGDTGSTDRTQEILSKYSYVKCLDIPFNGFGKSHNHLSSLAKHDWILSIDSDEVVTEELKKEIFETKLTPLTLYTIARKNFYKNRWVWSCGWWPDRVVRLYNRSETQFSDREVHEEILRKGMKIIDFKAPLHHFPFQSPSDFLQKLDRYTTLSKGGKKGSPFLHGMSAFLKSYLIKQGFLQGGMGFEISLYNGLSSYYKYLKRQ